MGLYSFDAVVHARPAKPAPGKIVLLDGTEVPTLAVTANDANRGFARTFEEVEAAAARLERMYFEPDGSFVWRSSAGEPAWQLDGMVYDRDGRVLYVELRGACSPDGLDAFLATLGWPGAPVMFQRKREAVYLDEPTFRRLAAAKQ
jgi:hypothetical protein